jgi:hypothetical protein
MELSDAQRQAKRARDAAYRARKAAEKLASQDEESESLGPVVNDDGTPTATTLAMFGIANPVVSWLMRAASSQLTETILRSNKGKAFESPRGGMPTVIVQKYRDGARLLTTDGRQIKRDALCTHELPDGYTGVYYEVVGGPQAGSHGWVHRARGCNRPYQID